MSMNLIGRRLSFFLNGQQVELEALPGQTLRVFFGWHEGRRTLRALSYSDSTPGAEPELCWIYDGLGWTPNEPSFTEGNQALRTPEQSDARPSSLDDESSPISSDGVEWTPPLKCFGSSPTKENRFANFGGPGQRPARGPGLTPPLTTCAEHAPRS